MQTYYGIYGYKEFGDIFNLKTPAFVEDGLTEWEQTIRLAERIVGEEIPIIFVKSDDDSKLQLMLWREGWDTAMTMNTPPNCTSGYRMEKK
jgi:hypothetical protein